VKVCIAKLRKSGKIHCSGQRIVLILDTTSDLPASVSKILVENWLHSQAVRANCIWQSERREQRELFARTICANIRIRVSVNTQAKTTSRTFARIVHVSEKRPLDSFQVSTAALVEWISSYLISSLVFVIMSKDFNRFAQTLLSMPITWPWSWPQRLMALVLNILYSNTSLLWTEVMLKAIALLWYAVRLNTLIVLLIWPMPELFALEV